MVSAEEAVAIYQQLTASGFQVWVTGGWGIDALLGEQTRTHKDLDLIVLLDDLLRLRQLLEGEGYGLKMLWEENLRAVDAHGVEMDTAFVLRDGQGRELDLHALRLDAQRNGIPAWQADEGFSFTVQDLAGMGVIGGAPVRCLTPEMQVTCHTGYALPEYQRADLERLRAKFGTGAAPGI